MKTENADKKLGEAAFARPRDIRLVKTLARISLGLVWIYEGLVPKILFASLHPEQVELVRQYWPFRAAPESTLVWLGIAQVIAGAILIAGWAERAVVAFTTLWMFALIALVAAGRPELLTDPFGALAKDFCLVACAMTVWLLSPRTPRRRAA